MLTAANGAERDLRSGAGPCPERLLSSAFPNVVSTSILKNRSTPAGRRPIFLSPGSALRGSPTKRNMQTSEKTPDDNASQAKRTGEDATGQVKNAAKNAAADIQSTADDAMATGKAHVQDAIKAASKQFDTVKSQVSQTTDYLTKAINDEPVKAVVVTAIVSSVLTALVLSALRDRDPY